MTKLSISRRDLDKSIAETSQYFGLGVVHRPRLWIKSGMDTSGSCDYYDWLPYFKGFITLSAEISDREKAVEILDHESIHWLEHENGLKGYKIFPHHFLHLVYNPDDETGVAWSDHFYAGIRNELFDLRSKIESPTLVELLEAYKECDDTPTKGNLREMEDLLRNAKQFSRKAITEDLNTAVLLYFTMSGHYNILLSIYTAEQFQENPQGAIQFLRDLKSEHKEITDMIPLSVKTFHYANFSSYNNLVNKATE